MALAGVVHIPWYATGFRGDKFEAALAEVAALATRYGATSYHVYRYRDDRYKFLQVAEFEDKAQWIRYWEGPEFTDWRIANMSYYQVPVIYGMTDIVVAGTMQPELVRSAKVAPGETEGDLVA